MDDIIGPMVLEIECTADAAHLLVRMMMSTASHMSSGQWTKCLELFMYFKAEPARGKR